MKIAVVTLRPEDEGHLASFLEQNALSPQQCWRMQNASVASHLATIEAEYHLALPDLILFPPSAEGNELATRLAWRLRGSAVCQARGFDGETRTVRKAVYGNALTATLQPEHFPLCLSVVVADLRQHAVFPADMPVNLLTPVTVSDALPPPDVLNKSAHPLQSARVVLAAGQGALDQAIARLAQKLKAETGFTRQRVMAGGCDEQRMLGISGQSVAPEVCLIAGASGASAFMAGVSQSQFIVAINHDPEAPVFAAADVGIVGEAEEVLEALASRVSSGS
ncbi:electron transfer flavoprotein subunit alpha/FixB family protein [Enterobacteriaceae bacterium C34A]